MWLIVIASSVSHHAARFLSPSKMTRSLGRSVLRGSLSPSPNASLTGRANDTFVSWGVDPWSWDEVGFHAGTRALC